MSLPSRILLACAACLALAGVAGAAIIEADVAFPSPNAPPLTAYVCETETSRIRTVPVAPGQGKFSIDVPPGHYLVFMAPNEPGAPDVYGAYTQFSLCTGRPAEAGGNAAASCSDHNLVPLNLTGKGAHATINIDDWYLSDQIAAQLDRIRGTPAGSTGEPLGAPRFSEYRVAQTEAVPAPRIDAGTSTLPVEERTRLQQGLGNAPNFAGSFSLFLTRCGATCEHLVLIDWHGGRILEPSTVPDLQGSLPCRNEESVLFRRDSRLLSVTRPHGDVLLTQYFVWRAETSTLALVAEYQRSPLQFCNATPP